MQHLFLSFGPQGSWALSLHFEEVFKNILTKKEFVDLDGLLNKKSLQNDDLVGKFCFYVGGLYGNNQKRQLMNTLNVVIYIFIEKVSL